MTVSGGATSGAFGLMGVLSMGTRAWDESAGAERHGVSLGQDGLFMADAGLQNSSHVQVPNRFVGVVGRVGSARRFIRRLSGIGNFIDTPTGAFGSVGSNL